MRRGEDEAICTEFEKMTWGCEEGDGLGNDCTQGKERETPFPF